jgi:hypothetical protein
MSHLFERLASSVTRPMSEPPLRPLAGSIYAPASQPASPDPLLEAGDSPAVPRFSRSESVLPREILTSTGQTLHPLADRSADVQTHAAPQNLNRPMGSQFSTEKELLLPIRHQESAPDFAPQMLSQRNRVPPSGESRAADRPSLTPRQAKEHETPSPETINARHHPLLPLKQSAPEGQSMRSLRDPELRVAAPAREPDEIFIHIGRVEVAAVQQPAARPAPAPQRRSVDLSDYLRRGSGRSR